jgi:hypothetical protein
MTDDFNPNEDDELIGEPSLDSLAPEVEEDEAEDLDDAEPIPLSSLKSSDLGDDADEEVEDEDEEEDDMELLGSEDWEE